MPWVAVTVTMRGSAPREGHGDDGRRGGQADHAPRRATEAHGEPRGIEPMSRQRHGPVRPRAHVREDALQREGAVPSAYVKPWRPARRLAG